MRRWAEASDGFGLLHRRAEATEGFGFRLSCYRRPAIVRLSCGWYPANSDKAKNKTAAPGRGRLHRFYLVPQFEASMFFALERKERNTKYWMMLRMVATRAMMAAITEAVMPPRRAEIRLAMMEST